MCRLLKLVSMSSACHPTVVQHRYGDNSSHETIAAMVIIRPHYSLFLGCLEPTTSQLTSKDPDFCILHKHSETEQNYEKTTFCSQTTGRTGLQPLRGNGGCYGESFRHWNSAKKGFVNFYSKGGILKQSVLTLLT